MAFIGDKEHPRRRKVNRQAPLITTDH